MNDYKPKITIVSGYYNRENYVDDSIESLINQSYDNYNIIVFDDASTDNTYSKLKKFENDYSFIKVIRHDRNKGFVQGLVDILSNTDSDFIAIHGSGDISFPNRITEEADFLINNPDVGVVSCMSIYSDQRTSEIKNRESVYVTTNELIKRNPIVHGAVMFRMSKYREVGGYRTFFTYSQDIELWLRMSLITKIVIIPLVLYRFTKIELSDTVSRNLPKVVLQSLLYSYSIQLISMRQKEGFDLIDIFGDKAGLLFNPNNSIKRIYKLILIQFYHQKEKNLYFLLNMSKFINGSLINVILMKLIRISFNVLMLRNLILKVLRLLLKDKKFNDYKVLSN